MEHLPSNHHCNFKNYYYCLCVSVWGIGTRVWGCPRLCMWVEARWSWVSCSITAYLIPLRWGLLMNLEPSWQSVSPSNGLCPSQHWVHVHSTVTRTTFLVTGELNSGLPDFAASALNSLSPLSVPRSSCLTGLCCNYLISEGQAQELAKGD